MQNEQWHEAQRYCTETNSLQSQKQVTWLLVIHVFPAMFPHHEPTEAWHREMIAEGTPLSHYWFIYTEIWERADRHLLQALRRIYRHLFLADSRISAAAARRALPIAASVLAERQRHAILYFRHLRREPRYAEFSPLICVTAFFELFCAVISRWWYIFWAFFRSSRWLPSRRAAIQPADWYASSLRPTGFAATSHTIADYYIDTFNGM